MTATDQIFNCFSPSVSFAFLSRLGLSLLLEVERLRGLSALLLWLHRSVCSHHIAASGLGGVCGDAGLPGRAVRGHAGPPAAAAKLPQPLHKRHEVQQRSELCRKLITHSMYLQCRTMAHSHRILPHGKYSH